jgi:hypothetical protein
MKCKTAPPLLLILLLSYADIFGKDNKMFQGQTPVSGFKFNFVEGFAVHVSALRCFYGLRPFQWLTPFLV